MRCKYAVLTFVLITGCIFGACGRNGTEESVSQNNTEENQTETENSEILKVPGLMGTETFANVYFLDTDGTYSPIYTGHTDIDQDVSKYKLFTSFEAFEPGAEDEWENLELMIFVVNNGELMDFSLDGENYADKHTINAYNGKELEQIFMLRSEDIGYSHGYITVCCMYNPQMAPKSGLDSFSGLITYSFEYDNTNGEEYAFSQTEFGEYIDIPQHYIPDAYGTDIGYRQEKDKYIMDFNHAYNDVTVNEDDGLYLKVNLGESVSGKFILAVICDGEIIKLDRESNFIGFEMDDGSKTFQCGIPTDGTESGLHYYQLVIIQQDSGNAAEMYVSSTDRYRVIIER